MILSNVRYPLIQALVGRNLSSKAFSSGSDIVTITEQKVKVGSLEINYVKSYVEGSNPSRTIVCLPGALGNYWCSMSFVFNSQH